MCGCGKNVHTVFCAGDVQCFLLHDFFRLGTMIFFIRKGRFIIIEVQEKISICLYLVEPLVREGILFLNMSCRRVQLLYERGGIICFQAVFRKREAQKGQNKKDTTGYCGTQNGQL